MPDLSLLAVMAFFVLTYFVTSKFLVEPINGVLEARAHDARTAEERHEEALKRFNEATAQIEERLHLAKREAAQLRDQYRAEAAGHRAALIDRAGNEAKGLVTEAEERLRQELEAARDRIVRESESLARLAAERLLGRSV